MSHPTGPAGPAPGGPTGPGRELAGAAQSRMPGKVRDAFVIGLAQNVILAGLIILTAGVPTW